MAMTEPRNPDIPSDDSSQLNQTNENLTKESVDESWQSRIAEVWNNTNTNLNEFKKSLSVEQAAQKIVELFSVSEAQVAEILATVQAE